jgi:hypothetical protein
VLACLALHAGVNFYHLFVLLIHVDVSLYAFIVRFVELADEKGLVPLEYQDSVRPELPVFRRLNAALSGDAPVGWTADQAAEAQRCVWPAGCWATIPRHAYY